MEELKSLGEITSPDRRTRAFPVVKANRNVRPMLLEDLYKAVESLQLPPTVPEEIRSYFNTSCNVFLYGWFAYALYAVAGLHAYTAIELALKSRCESSGYRTQRWGLAKLLKHAISNGWVADQGFTVVKRAGEQRVNIPEKWIKTRQVQEPERYCDVLANALPKLRNELAHPNYEYVACHNDALFTLQIASDLIKQLFPSGEEH